MGRRAVLAVAVAATALIGCSANDPPGGEGRLSLATGGSGGVYQVYGGALADLLSDELPDSPTTAETTSASVDNLLLVAKGESDIAFSLGDSAIDAVKGAEPFDGPQPIRALARIYPNITQVVVPADSGVERIEDLRGKTVSVGAPNSGTEIIALRLMEVAGLDPDGDVDTTGLSVGESVAALRDGTIDAFFWSGGVPTGAVTDLATTDEIRLLALDGYLAEMRERFGEAYQEGEIEEGGYKGVPATKTIGVPNLIVVHESMPDDQAEAITRVLFEGKKRLQEIVPQAESLDPEEAEESIEPVPLHPGAKRFYDAGGDRHNASLPAAPPAPSPETGRPSRVAARDAAGRGVALPLTGDGSFALRYRHSVLGAPAEERFRADGPGFALEAVASPSRAVLDYYERSGDVTREGSRWVLRFDEPARFTTMPLAATGIGRRTLVAGDRAAALYGAGGRVSHLTIGLEGA